MKRIIAALLMLLCWTMTAYAYNGNEEDITLSATAEREIAPDMAYVYFSVLGEGSSSREATQQAAAKAGAVKRGLLKLALTGQDLSQVSYSVNPVYNDKRKLVGYKADNNIKLQVNKLEKLGEIIDALSESGVDSIDNIQYTVSNKEYYQNLLLQDAVKIAQNKAKIVAAAGGRTLGRMLCARVNSYTSMARIANGTMLKTAQLDAVTVLETKNITVRADLEAVFALE